MSWLDGYDDAGPPWQATITVTVWQCLRCGHQWLPQQAVSLGFNGKDLPRLAPPVKCAGCGSHLWNKVRNAGIEKDLLRAAEIAVAGRRRGR
jgi:DNA-directed RNA polymerase subunit RPC12/RpoP